MKNYLIKLKNIFAFRNIKNLGFYILLFLISVIYLFVKKEYFVILFIIILIILFYIYNKTLLYYSLIFSFIVIIFLIINNYNFKKNLTDQIDCVCKVIKVVSYDDYDKVYVKNKYNNFIFNTSDIKLSSGDVIYIKGKIVNISKAHFKGGFNYYDYLRYQNIKGQIDIEEVVLIKHKFGLNIFHEKVNNYIKKTFKKDNAQIIQALIIGEKHNLNDDLNNQIKKVGISHLFVISGLHIELINKALDKILSIIKIKDKIKHVIILLILFFYYILTSFLVSILRVIISFIFNKVLKKYFKELSPIDKLSFNACIVLLINPFNLFSYSFLLSYMIVFGILIISPKLKNKKGIKSFLYNNILISFTSTLISLPIVIRISSDVNILSILFNLFFIPFVSYILLPCSFLVFVIPKLEIVYGYIVKFFISITSYLAKVDILTLSFSFIPMVLIIIFYILFFLIFINKIYGRYKKILVFVFIIYLFFLFYLPYFNPTSEVSFIDLPSGDAVLIHEGYNKKNILIDTGDLEASDLVSFLKSKGIKRIDAVIISHGDSDHIGGLRTLVYEFKINNIFLSYYDSVSKEEISKYRLTKTNIYYLKAGDEFYIDKMYFKVLWPSSNQLDVNNNSLVIYSVLFNTRFLFTGDIEKEAEYKLIKEIGKIEVDVLKVAHHGSKTSSTEIFLNSVKFKYAVSMNGYKNTFGFPHSSVVERINSIDNVYMFNTLECGTITFYRNNKRNNLKISMSYE